MKFDPILVVSIILYSVSRGMCAKVMAPPSDEKPVAFTVADYIISKLSDLNPHQDPKTLFDKSYAIFCKLVSLSKVFPDSQNLLENQPDSVKQRIPKNLFDVLVSNLNGDGQFKLYPEETKISITVNLAEYQALIEYMINIQTLVPSQDYVNSFASTTEIDKGQICNWHQFIHRLKMYDSSLFENNPFFQFINDIESIFYFPHRPYSSEPQHKALEEKLSKLQRLLGRKISEQIMYHGSSFPSVSSPEPQCTVRSESEVINCSECVVTFSDNYTGILKKTKKGHTLKKTGEKKRFAVSRNQLKKLKQSCALVCIDESILEDDSTEEQFYQERCFNHEADQLQSISSSTPSSLDSLPMSTCPDQNSTVANDNSTENQNYRERCFNPGLDESGANPSTPSPSGASFSLIINGFGSQDTEPLIRVKLSPTLPIFACATLALYSIRAKRDLTISHKDKVVEYPLVKILTYGSQASNILNKKTYNKLMSDLQSSKDEANLKLSAYIEQQVNTGNSKTVNNILQKLCQDEDDSDEEFGYIMYNGKSAHDWVDASEVKKIIDFFYDDMD